MILVTGSDGFIGSHMLKGLSDLKTDAVVHMAAISDTTCNDWGKLRETNVDWTLQLARDCHRQGVPFLYASSASVYGNGNGPLNLYAKSKWQVDQMMEGMPGRWYGLRLFNVWGAGEGHKGKQASVIHQLCNGLRSIWAPEVRRDFVHVSDCVSVARWIIEHEPPSGIYDVGTNSPTSFWQLTKRYGTDTKVIPIPRGLLPHYQFDTCADLTKLREVGYRLPFKKAV